MNDAHLHLQKLPREQIEDIVLSMQQSGIARCVVNGTSPNDWQQVQQLAMQYPNFIIPSYGLHPWETNQFIADWKELLTQYIEASAQDTPPCIGECGLDRWMKEPNRALQEEAFTFQLELATRLNAPLSIHILRAWGWFLDMLRAHRFPARGFLLHSYNGSIELLPELIKAGAYFSFSGYYLHDKKTKQQEVFKAIPIDRLLIETDAPDMLPPGHVITHPLGKYNHPSNLVSIHQHLAKRLAIDEEKLKKQLNQNFSDFFLRR